MGLCWGETELNDLLTVALRRLCSQRFLGMPHQAANPDQTLPFVLHQIQPCPPFSQGRVWMGTLLICHPGPCKVFVASFWNDYLFTNVCFWNASPVINLATESGTFCEEPNICLLKMYGFSRLLILHWCLKRLITGPAVHTGHNPTYPTAIPKLSHTPDGSLIMQQCDSLLWANQNISPQIDWLNWIILLKCFEHT